MFEMRMKSGARLTLAACGLGSVVFCAWKVMGDDAASALEEDSRNRVYIDVESNRTFGHRLSVGDRIPLDSPFTGRATGYPAERCFWTAEGKVKREPTYVLLNLYRGVEGPTFCPDCGRLVVVHNPFPDARSAPPPTREDRAGRTANARN